MGTTTMARFLAMLSGVCSCVAWDATVYHSWMEAKVVSTIGSLVASRVVASYLPAWMRPMAAPALGMAGGFVAEVLWSQSHVTVGKKSLLVPSGSVSTKMTKQNAIRMRKRGLNKSGMAQLAKNTTFSHNSCSLLAGDKDTGYAPQNLLPFSPQDLADPMVLDDTLCSMAGFAGTGILALLSMRIRSR